LRQQYDSRGETDYQKLFETVFMAGRYAKSAHVRGNALGSLPAKGANYG
jgi:hypothetical protein